MTGIRSRSDGTRNRPTDVHRRACSGRPPLYGVLMALAESPGLSASNPGSVRHDWTRAEVRALFELPFPELMFEAARIHRMHFDPAEVQISTLLSIKTGGCPEDCAGGARLTRRRDHTQG